MMSEMTDVSVSNARRDATYAFFFELPYDGGRVRRATYNIVKP